MRLPLLFRRENSHAARRERAEALEKALTEGLRTLSTVFKQMADAVEQRRLSRQGFQQPESFLKRTDRKDRFKNDSGC